MSLRDRLEWKYLINREAEYSVEEVGNEVISLFCADKEKYIDVTGFAKDYYLSPSLTVDQKALFYAMLKEAGFFQQVNASLYSDDFSICSWSVYIIGKFSNKENAVYLEAAYVKYLYKNPMLSYRCLSELRWLRSEKSIIYLSALSTDQSIFSKLILLFYWEIQVDSPEFRNLLTDKELIEFIAPGIFLADMEDEISMRLLHFENYISGIYDSVGLESVGRDKFENIAKEYFKTYHSVPDEDAEKSHQEFLKSLGDQFFDHS